MAAAAVLAMTAMTWSGGAASADDGEVAYEVAVVGDSYASGEGAGLYDPDTASDVTGNRCHRSLEYWGGKVVMPGMDGPNYLHLEEVPVNFLACSGAVTDNVLYSGQYGEPAQLAAGRLSPTTTHVFLSLGGNDVGFAPVIETCLASSDCRGSTEVLDARSRMEQAQAGWHETLETIHEQAPNATIMWAGYPELLQGDETTSSSCVGISTDEALTIDELSHEMRRQQVDVAREAYRNGIDVRYVDTIGAFEGRGACTADPAINGLIVNPEAEAGAMNQESFHPNQAGTSLYGEAVSQAMVQDDWICGGELANQCMRDFGDEAIFHTDAGETFRMPEGIYDQYVARGGPDGDLGQPTSDREYLDDGTLVQHFEYGDLQL